MSNIRNTVIYIGVTSNLQKRVYQHKIGLYKGFTSKYNCKKLVYFEEFSDIRQAIAREKKLKAGNRKHKEYLIDVINPKREDLAKDWRFDI